MPLDGDLWGTIETQRQDAIDDPPASMSAFREGYPRRSFFEELYDEAGGSDGSRRRIPLSYYTKACGWASDYPLLYRRVAGFINPGALDRLTFDEYVLREFGCRSETLAKLTADGWFVPMLLRREQYGSNAAEAIETFFERVNDEETRWEVEPKYLNLVDTTLEAAATKQLDDTAAYVRAPTGDRVDIAATKRRWKEQEPWASLPTEGIDNVHGVDVHDDLQEYIVERAVKLRLLDDVYNVITADQEQTNNLRELAERYVSGEAETRETMVRTAYVLWNHYGTPAYYCDFTGSVDVGPDPARRYVDYLLSQAKALFGTLWNRLEGTIRDEPLQTKELNIWETDGARLSELLRFSPSEVRELKLGDRYRFLAGRADHFGDHYEAFRGRLNTVADDGTTYDEYATIVADHNDRTR
ncbi:MAG: hypothetical protein ABEI27_09705 [Halobellus sp.]|uniref:hypothetical protein n=1 Tax=Halobellus sp. TaxID=1979212 RepID=UPI0035D47FE8